MGKKKSLVNKDSDGSNKSVNFGPLCALTTDDAEKSILGCPSLNSLNRQVLIVTDFKGSDGRGYTVWLLSDLLLVTIAMKAAEAHETIQIQYNLCRAVPNQQVACKDLGNGVIEVSGLGSSRATTFAHVHNDGSLSQLWAKTIDTQRRSLLGMGTAAYSDPMRVVVRAFERELAVRISIVAKSEAPERTYEAVSRIQQSIQECVYAGTCYHSLALQTNTSSDSDAAIAAVVGQHQFQKVRDNVLRAANVLTTEVSRSPDAMHLSLLWDSCNVVLVAAQTLVDLIMCDIVKDKISLDRVMLEGSYWRKTVGGNVLPDTKVKRISAVFKNPWKRSPKISKYKQTPPLAPLPLEYRSLTSTPLSTPLEADEVTYSSNVSAVHLDESSRTRAQTHSHKSSNTYIPSTSPSTRRRTDSTTHVHLVDDFNFDVVQNAQDVAASIQGNKYISAHVVKDKGQQLKSISDIHTQGRKYARSGSDTKMLAVDSGQLTLATSTSVPYDMYAYTQVCRRRTLYTATALRNYACMNGVPIGFVSNSAHIVQNRHFM